MATGLASQLCANHPDRPGRALCMNCKKVVCQECATQWEGINFCVACLKARREKSTEKSTVAGWLAISAAIVLLFYAASGLMAWSASILAGLF